MKVEDIMIQDYGRYYKEAIELYDKMFFLNRQHKRLIDIREKILSKKCRFFRSILLADKLNRVSERLLKNEVQASLNISRVKVLTEKALEIKEDLLAYNKKQIEEKIIECGIDPKDGLGAILVLQGKFDNYDSDGDQEG